MMHFHEFTFISTPKFIDAHIHLDLFPGEEREGFIEETRKEDTLLIHNSLSPRGYLSDRKCYAGYENILCGLGWHPMETCKGEELPGDLESLVQKASFIGEIGLDFCWVEDRRGDGAQRRIFQHLMELALAHGKAQQIHTKGAEAEVLDTLKALKPQGSLIHWYSGPGELLKAYLDLGCYFTLGPDILTNRSITLGKIPLDRILIETDGPEGVPWICDRERQSNDLELIYDRTAKAYGVETEELCRLISENFLRWINCSAS